MRSVCAVEVKNRSHTQRMKALAYRSLRRSFLRHLRNRLRSQGEEKNKDGDEWNMADSPSCGRSHLIATFPDGLKLYHLSPSLPSHMVSAYLPLSIAACCTAAWSPVSLCSCMRVSEAGQVEKLGHPKGFFGGGAYISLSICSCCAFIFTLLSVAKPFSPFWLPCSLIHPSFNHVSSAGSYLLSCRCLCLSACLHHSLSLPPSWSSLLSVLLTKHSEWHSPVMTDACMKGGVGRVSKQHLILQRYHTKSAHT